MVSGTFVETIRDTYTDPKVHPEVRWEAQVRCGSELPLTEIEFRANRLKKVVCPAFARFIGVPEAEVTPENVPVIALAGSGGGYRAMVSTLGYLTACDEAGVLDCSTYLAGVSGSCWTIMQYFVAARGSTTELEKHISQQITTSLTSVSALTGVLTSPAAASVFAGLVSKFDSGMPLSLVDIYGTLLMSRLLMRSLTSTGDPADAKLTGQQRYLADGRLPMPIYTAVRHEIIRTDGKVMRADDPETGTTVAGDWKQGLPSMAELKSKMYQWFEFTPYEMGTIDGGGVWIPAWGFGRPFRDGRSLRNLPEPSAGLYLGMFGSAFCATIAHLIDEVKGTLSAPVHQYLEGLVRDYQLAVTTTHPIAPSCFHNPFYRPSEESQSEKRTDENTETTTLFDSEQLCLMDAGMNNNLPFYPLLRPERNVDVMLLFDASSDIDETPWFERASKFARQHGITRWPKGAAPWPRPSPGAHEPPTHNSAPNVRTDGEGSSQTPTPPSIALVYYPLLANPEYEVADFDPATADFCSTYNFSYTPEQVKSLSHLSQYNFMQEKENLRDTLKQVWLRKKTYLEKLHGQP
ncbi:acyl transferase/acyl hydrolase/lysophospholipase [Dimargaris cristalligena]|uniref:Lysophospholipase n=1 Tax=Dimargaris cristalligena TaxID=215637 RepID=A0A4P9ZS20_9FUNG|nr:acyl transferase/acyl hydrolase/lysophospholipase [Dimargaris cristalligena]|eukprot:RKP35988.1 acyl transferase/acyl hydrolase/lysophospholipase [Dimargaris cristalligena]